MKRSLKLVIALILLVAAIVGASVFAALHYHTVDALKRVDYLWLKITISILCFLLTAILLIELYGLFYYPSARRLILRAIGFITAVGGAFGITPLGWFALEFAQADFEKGQFTLSLSQAARTSVTIAAPAFVAILILTKWYIDLLKWETKENGGKLLE